MIAPMTKYSMLLYHKEYARFLEQLQELGLVDVTIGNREPGEEERRLASLIGQYQLARLTLEEIAKNHPEEVRKAAPFANAPQAFEQYQTASGEKDRITSHLAKIRSEVDMLRPWGIFDAELFEKLAHWGIHLQFYTADAKVYEKNRDEWSEHFTIEEIGEQDGKVYFVLIQYGTLVPVDIDAHEEKTPGGNYLQWDKKLEELEKELERQEEILFRCAKSVNDLQSMENELKNNLEFNKALYAGNKEADGSVVVLEGWALAGDAGKVEQLLNDEEVVFIKARPTPEDETPVLLKNKSYPRLFEFIGDFYSLPKYGSLDLTPYFAPFYMIFFGFCLGDAGYGLLFVLGGLYMVRKLQGVMKQVGWLTILCGASTIVFGVLAGSFFGVQLAKLNVFSGVNRYFLTSDNLFTLAIGVGFVHLLFAMSLKVVNFTRQFGFKYALSTMGWMIVIIASLAAYLLSGYGIGGFSFGSAPYFIVIGIGFFMMLFLNSPGKNPLVNLGNGLWNTYNDISGLLGDVLSYIRLFALGLSGGILALVFNDLAVGLSPDIPVVKQIVALFILLVGHGITLFMSALGAFVHPMRLTFVEFYKNAGFEASQRPFNPLKKSSKL